MTEEDRLLTLSGIQHYAFCPRQWALIFIEQQWADNYRTVDGTILHTRAHDETVFERRGDTLTARGLRVVSRKLGVTGICDVVEFQLSQNGIAIHGQSDLWQPYPVEYKRGSPKTHEADELQLCGQAMCLEEMLLCEIPEGCLYYGETKHRQKVLFGEDMRKHVKDILSEMEDCMSRGYTPKPKAGAHCNACSLRELCLPRLHNVQSVSEYLHAAAEDMDGDI